MRGPHAPSVCQFHLKAGMDLYDGADILFRARAGVLGQARCGTKQDQQDETESS